MRGNKRRKEVGRKRERVQRDVLRDVMLSAGQCATWLTLRELGLLTSYGEASISAQLRHLRKPLFGGFVVEKRKTEVVEVVGRAAGPVWEYRISHAVRQAVAKRRMRGPLAGNAAALSAERAAVVC